MVASILIEPVRGEGGYNPAPASFLQGLRRICDEHGILLIADEVQTGFARTGRMWGFEHAGIVPDVVVLAKAIANGLPLSAIATSASADGALGQERPRLDVRRQSRRLRRRASPSSRRSPTRGSSRTRQRAARSCGRAWPGSRPRSRGSATSAGPGLMIGVEFVRDRATREPDGALAKAAIARAADSGLLVLTCGSSGQVDPLDPADRRDGGRDQRGGRDLRRDAPDGLSGSRHGDADDRARTWRSARPRRTGASRNAMRASGRRRPVSGAVSAVLGEELHHVVEPEATIAPLADAIERKLAAIPEPLHGVDVEMEHLGDFGRREHRPEFVDGHGPHMVVASLCACFVASAPVGWPEVECGSLMGGAYGWA